MHDLELIKQRWLAIMTSDDSRPEEFGERAARELILVERGFWSVLQNLPATTPPRASVVRSAIPAVQRIRERRAALLELEFRRTSRSNGFDPETGVFMGALNASTSFDAQRERWFAPLLPEAFDHLFAPLPAPAPGTPTQTAPAIHGEIR